MFPTGPYYNKTILQFVAVTIKLLIKDNKENEAEKIIREALQIVEGNHLCEKFLLSAASVAYGKAERWVKAEIYRAKLLHRFPDSFDVLLKRRHPSLLESAHVYAASRKYEEAYKCYKKYLKNVEPKDVSEKLIIYPCLGETCKQLGRYKEAYDYFKISQAATLETGDQLQEKEYCRALAICCNSLGKFDEAIRLIEKVLFLSNEIDDQTGIGHDYDCLGSSYSSLGNNEKAIEYYREAIKKHQEVGDRLGEGNVYGNLGNLHKSMGQFEIAKQYLDKCLAVGDETKHPLLQLAGYQSLGDLFLLLGQGDKAVEYFEKSLMISSKLGDQVEIGTIFHCLARANDSRGNYDEAIEYYQKCLGIFIQSGTRVEEAHCYSGLATVYDSLGNFDEAMKNYEKFLKICQETGEPLDRYYSGVGVVYSNREHFEKAEELFRKSLLISKQMGDKSEEASTYTKLGFVYRDLGEYENGVIVVRKALSICLEIGDRVEEGKCYATLGLLYNGLRKYGKALDYCNKSLAVNKETGNRLGEAENYGLLGDVHSGLGSMEKAVEYAKMSHDVYDSIGSQNYVANQCMVLGSYYLVLNQPPKAIEWCEKGIAIAEQNGYPLGSKYQTIGEIYFFANQCEKAEHFLKKGIKESDKFASEFNADRNRALLSQQCYRAHTILSYVYRQLRKNDQRAFLVLDLGKAKALQILLEQRRYVDSSSSPGNSYRERSWQQIEDCREDQRLKDIAKDLCLKEDNAVVLVYSLERFVIRPMDLVISVLNCNGELYQRVWTPENESRKTVESWIFELTERLMSSVSVDLDRNCSFFGLVDNPTLSSPTNFLPSSENFIPDVSTDMSSNVTSMTATKREGNDEKEDNPQPSDCVDSIDSWYSIPLYSALIEPVADLIQGNKLIIVPDKVLFFSPFCMLKDKEGHYLSERYSIQITPSLHTLALSMQVPRSDFLGPALFVGNPTVGEVILYEQRIKVSPLPSSAEEARTLASRFNANPLIGKEATKDRVLKSMDKASIIHIAAHGLPDNGEILLAPNVGDSVEDDPLPRERSYLLTHRDVITRQLSAKLVVLSCCHTARGKPTTEGVLGIARAFLGAGARAVLVALWRLPDFETKVFMEHFYEEICNGSSSCLALKTVMNIFQKSDDAERRSFRKWAPFTIIGEDVVFTKEEIEEIRKCSGNTGE